MRTLAIKKTGAKEPWLERYTPSSSAPEVIDVREFPFTLGRGDNCDYKIPSTRVSREHAEILRTTGGYAIRDLGSTNGTIVNGQRADKSRLQDGDLILIADVELTFRMASEAAPVRTVTQIMPGHSEEEDRQENVPLEMVQAVRARHERLLGRGVRSHFQLLVDLASGKPAGRARAPDQAWCRLLWGGRAEYCRGSRRR